MTGVMSLISIPVVEIPPGFDLCGYTAGLHSGRLDRLMLSARRTYTRAGMLGADAASRAWAARVTTPYGAEVERLSRTIGRRGAYLLNYSYQWGCTSGALPESGGGAVLLRTLDWPFDGLGEALLLTRHMTANGPVLSATWPGYAGILTGMAPGRFAAAINQPPLPAAKLGRAAGWLIARGRVRTQTALPPDHALRWAFENCTDFAGAVDYLSRVPLCMPVIYTLAGTQSSERVVLERTETGCCVPACPFAANHWAAPGSRTGAPRNATSLARRASLQEASPDWSLGWLPPVLVPDTRVVMMASAQSGRLLLQGWEARGAVTEVLQVG